MSFTNFRWTLPGTVLFALGIASGLPLRSPVYSETESGAEGTKPSGPALKESAGRTSGPEKMDAVLEGSSSDPFVIRSEFRLAAGEMNASQVRAAVERLGRDRKSRLALEPLLERWIELDGSSAFAYLLRHDLRMGKLLAKWYRLDPGAAEKAVLAMPEGEPKIQASMILYKSMADTDPERAAACIRNLPWIDTYFLPQEIYSRWARRDREAALEQAMASPESSRSMAVSGVVREWLKTDPHAALAWTNACEDNDVKSSALSALAEGWAESDPQAAVKALYEIENARPAESDALGLGGLGLQIVPNGCSTALGGWFEEDFAAAWNWLQSLKAEDARVKLLQGPAGSALMRMNPERALQTVLQEPAGEGRSNILESLVRNWATLSAEAEAWVKQQQDIRIQKVVWPALVANMRIERSLPLLPTMNSEVRALAFERIAANAPMETWPRLGSWILQQPSGTEKDGYVRALVRRWGRWNKEEVVSWINTLPPGSAANAARDTLAKDL